MRHVLSTALVALIVGALAGVTASAIAQSPDEQSVTPAAGINADTVDGRHAVGYSSNRAKRQGKLVATNNRGLLPSNIVRPFWGAIRNAPAGFADGVDDGVTEVKITRVQGPYTQVFANSTGTAWGVANVDCPAGSSVIGGGYWSPTATFTVNASVAIDSDTWSATATLLGTTGQGWVSAIFRADAICMTVKPAGALAAASRASEAKPAKVVRRR